MIRFNIKDLLETVKEYQDEINSLKNNIQKIGQEFISGEDGFKDKLCQMASDKVKGSWDFLEFGKITYYSIGIIFISRETKEIKQIEFTLEELESIW